MKIPVQTMIALVPMAICWLGSFLGAVYQRPSDQIVDKVD